MISSLNSTNQQFLNNLQRITDQLNTDELEISSGVQMRQVSDNPDQVSELLQARAALATSQQISTNLSSVKTEVDTGEQSMESAVQLFDQVQTLGAEGATGTQTASSRAALADQLQTIEQQMVGLANTSINGRYIFAGDADQTEPYTFDPTQSAPVSAYQGTASTRITQDATGGTFPIALTAQQIFDSSDPTTNVFSAINGLVTALNSNDQTAILTSVNGLAGVGQYLNQSTGVLRHDAGQRRGGDGLRADAADRDPDADQHAGGYRHDQRDYGHDADPDAGAGGAGLRGADPAYDFVRFSGQLGGELISIALRSLEFAGRGWRRTPAVELRRETIPICLLDSFWTEPCGASRLWQPAFYRLIFAGKEPVGDRFAGKMPAPRPGI